MMLNNGRGEAMANPWSRENARGHVWHHTCFLDWLESAAEFHGDLLSGAGRSAAAPRLPSRCAEEQQQLGARHKTHTFSRLPLRQWQKREGALGLWRAVFRSRAGWFSPLTGLR